MDKFVKTLAVTTRVALLSGVAATGAFAQESCTEMQAYLSISPNHRDDVMAYIAPKLKEEMGVNLVAEEIGSAKMIERISAQLPNPRVSVAHWDVAVGISACETGLCAPIDTARAPSTSDLYDWAYSKNAAGETEILTTNALAIGLIYNEEELAKAGIPVPTSWNDLASPALAGRISITAPASTFGTAALVEFARLGGGGEDNIDPGFAFVEKIMPNMHTVHTWSSELSNLLQLGEVWVATAGSNMSPVLRESGLPVRWTLPEEGGPLASGGVSLVKGAPCTDAAYRYLDLYYGDDFQLLRARHGGVASPAPRVWEKLTEADVAGMDMKQADLAHVVDFDWKKINAVRPEWIERWTREVN